MIEPTLTIPKDLAENIVLSYDSDDLVALEGFITELQEHLEE